MKSVYLVVIFLVSSAITLVSTYTVSSNELERLRRQINDYNNGGFEGYPNYGEGYPEREIRREEETIEDVGRYPGQREIVQEKITDEVIEGGYPVERKQIREETIREYY